MISAAILVFWMSSGNFGFCVFPVFPSRCHGDCNAGGATDALPWCHVTRSGNSSGCINELQFPPSAGAQKCRALLFIIFLSKGNHLWVVLQRACCSTGASILEEKTEV
ncbi:uncharacterized [Tachysurus ichikawai]